VGQFELNIRFKGYVYRQRLYTVRFGNGTTTTLLLEVFTQKNFVEEFIRFKWIFFTNKTTNSLFEPFFGRFRGNAHTLSIPRWKARAGHPVRDNWTFFASSYGWEVISRYWSMSALFRSGGSLWLQILDGRRRRPQPMLVSENYCFCYLTLKTVWCYLHSSGYSTSMWQTDGRMDNTRCRVKMSTTLIKY